MKRSNMSVKVLSVSSLIVVLGASLGLAGQARADHNTPAPTLRTGGYGNNYDGRGYTPGYTPGCEPQGANYYYRQAERARGERDGFIAGRGQGFQAGYNGHVHNHACGLNLSRESGAYQRGFHDAFAAGYDEGFRSGAAKRLEEQRCRYDQRRIPFTTPRYNFSIRF